MKINYTISFWVLLLLIFIAKILYIGWGPLDLVPDEAHYWDWSRHLDISYYSKGPFIAYNIFLGTKLGELLHISPPNPCFWVRIGAVINSTLLGIVAWFLANRIWKDRRASFYVILFLTALPLYAVGSILMTIDNPLMLFWALYMYLVFLALDAPNSKGAYWYLSGIILGLGFLSKYTMIILLPCTLFYLAATPRHRFWLKRKEFYLSLLIACIFFLPVVIWNMKHDWIGIRHVVGQAGLAGRKLQEAFFHPLYMLEFIGIQFGVVSPIIFILMVAGFFRAWRLRSDYRYSFLFWIGVPLGVFYFILSIHEYCQANWPAPIYFAGALIAGNLFRGRKISKIGIGIGVFMSLLVFSIDLLPPIASRLDPTIRARGWKKLGEEIEKIRTQTVKKDITGPDAKCFVFSDTYQVTSELAFYIPGNPNTFCINLGRRMNQYDLWSDFSSLIGYDALYVKRGDQEIDPEVTDSFKLCRKLPILEIWQGKRFLSQYSVFLCQGFKGMAKKDNKNEVTY